jgi:hypothetical protein
MLEEKFFNIGVDLLNVKSSEDARLVLFSGFNKLWNVKSETHCGTHLQLTFL